MVSRTLALVLLVCAVTLAEDDSPYLVLVADGSGELYQKAAEVVASLHPKATVRTFDPARLEDLLPDLQKAPPRYVCLVVPREVIDVRFARRLFLLSTRVDEDPFPDFAYGFVTGEDGGGAFAFARAIQKAASKKRTNRILAVMTHDGDASTQGTETILGGVERGWLSVGSEDEKKEERLALYARKLDRPKARLEKGSATVTIEVRDFEASDHVRSKYRADGDRWGTECAFALPLPNGLDPKGVTVTKANVDAMNGVSAHFAVETRGAERILHVVVPFDADEEAVSEQVEKEGYRLELAIEGREGH